MTDTEEPSPVFDPPSDRRSPCSANAYAITFRLLGDRSEAVATAEAVATTYRSHEHEDPSTWLPDLATDAVTASLLAAQLLVDPDDEASSEQRRALRRRLSTVDGRSRAAGALRHLAGYPVERVAELMGTDPDTVEELASPIAPPPQMSWRDLGDPIEREGVPPIVRRRRHRRVPWRWMLAAGTVILLIVWAGRLSGPRPSLGRLDPGAGGRSFAASVAPLESSGCAVAQDGDVPPQRGVTPETIELGDTAMAFRLSDPGGGEPAPLLVALPGYGQTAAQFEETAGLEKAFPGDLVATLEPPAPALEWNASGDPVGTADLEGTIAVAEEIITSRCVDLTRVHVIGFGSGAQMAGAVACAAPEIFASVTMVGGSQMPDGCELRPHVAALLTANLDDPVIRPTGGYGPEAPSVPAEGAPQRPEAEEMDEVADRWARSVGADEDKSVAEADDTLIVTRTGSDGVVVETILHPAGAHSWGLGDSLALAVFLPDSARSP